MPGTLARSGAGVTTGARDLGYAAAAAASHGAVVVVRSYGLSLDALLMHWSEKYIGKPWIEGIHDCVNLVLQVQRLEFGRALAEPPRARETLAAALAAIRAVASPVVDEPPQDGDVVLMRAPKWHLGVWCSPNGRPSVLHCARVAGTVLTPMDGLYTAGMRLEGIYRCS